jgi:hypothetical protein
MKILSLILSQANSFVKLKRKLLCRTLLLGRLDDYRAVKSAKDMGQLISVALCRRHSGFYEKVITLNIIDLWQRAFLEYQEFFKKTETNK